MAQQYWLLKAEPDSRVVKGKDVKFSVDDFEQVKTSPWEGVRSYEARNLMKEMKVGQEALFYHSNCKTPGIAAFAKVTKQAYPDYTAWDASHPYFDPKSKSDDPRWFMVDVTFSSRAKNFIPLALLRYIADRPTSDLPEEICYIGEEGASSIKAMDLIRKGRLSVQRITPEAWSTLAEMAEKGGWSDLELKPKKKAKNSTSTPTVDEQDEPGQSVSQSKRSRRGKSATRRKVKGKTREEVNDSEDLSPADETPLPGGKLKEAIKRKREATDDPHPADGLRRSTRARR